MKINSLFLILISILFLGCVDKSSIIDFYNIDINSANKTAYFKHFNILPPVIKDENEAKKWHFFISNNIHAFVLSLKDKDKIIRLNYRLEIRTRSGENYTFKDGLVFGKTKTWGYKEHDLERLEAIKNKDEKYLQNYYNQPSYKNDGITFIGFGNINKYSAIIIDKHTKYKDMDKYSRTYSMYSYSKTGKLKRYDITISADIDKPYVDDPKLLVEYSFDDMLKRSQISLDSFTPTDEDFIEGKFSEYNF